MSTINYTYNVIVDRFRQFAAGHFQLRRFTHGEISQADLEKEAEWPWLHVKPRAINYSPGTRSFQFEIFISDLPRDKEDKTGYQAESITDCSLIFQDLINEIYLGNMFGSDVVLTRPVNAEPFVEQYTHTLTGVTGTIELSLDYDWSACSIPASWNYNTPTDSGTDGWGAIQFIDSLDQNGVYVSLLNDVEAPGNSYYYGTDEAGVKGWHAIVDNIGLTCETLPDCATIISILDDIAALQTDIALKANTADLGATAFSNDYNDLDNLPTIPAAQVNSDWNSTSGVSEILNKPSIPSIVGLATVTYVDQQDALKVDKIAGKGLSTNDYTTAEQTKLAGIQAGAEVNVNADWNAVSGDAQILNKPTIPSIAGLVPDTRTITINGTTQDLSANRTFTIASNPGTVTSVAALTLGTTGTDLSSTVANGTSTPVITLNVPTASATNRGALSSADWSTFNGKFTLPSLTSGSVLFSNGTTIAQNNANFFWDNTNSRLGIGTASPNSRVNALDGTVSELKFNSGYLNLTPSLAVGNTGGSGKFACLIAGTSAAAFIYDSAGYFDIATDLKSNYTANTLGGSNYASKMRVQSNGNVQIGTTTDAGYKLDVNGTARVQNDLTITDTFKIVSSVNTNSKVTFGSNLALQGQSGILLQGGHYITLNGVVFGTTSVNASAVLQADSTNRGFLPPRMTTTQKNAIASPAVGLMVFDTTLNKLCVRGASAWETITSV